MSGHLNVTKEQFAAFRALDRTTPIHMLNLVRLRAEAAYEDGTRATGAEAYATYGKHSGPIFAAAGGTVVWRGAMEAMLIGPDDKRWDICFIAAYPNAQAFLDMVANPDYQAIVHHRMAALEDSRLIRMAPGEDTATFG